MFRDHLLSLVSGAYGVFGRGRQILVLTLHRVGGPAQLGVQSLRQHLAYLARHYRVVTPSQLPAAAQQRRVALVTIDDCHHDTADVIFPAALEVGVPITICVPTDFFLRNQWLWFDRLNWALRQVPVGRAFEVGGLQLTVGNAEAHARLSRLLKQHEPDARDALIEQVLSQLGVTVPPAPTPEYRPVPPEQLRRLLATGMVELCAHTVTHPIMSHTSDAQLRVELEQSKRELEEFSGQKVVSFCYPNGESGDFDARTRRGLQDAGFRVAFTSIEGVNRPGQLDWLELKRLHAHPRFSVFAKLASGLGEWQRGPGARSATAASKPAVRYAG